MNRRLAGAAAFVLGAFTLCDSNNGMPPRGSAAPTISLRSLAGEVVSTAALRQRPLILIFGELNHERTRRACAEVLDGLLDPRFAGTSVVPILIVAEDAPEAQLKETAAQGRFPAIILQDARRESYSAYEVIALPSCVVIDGQGMVVYCLPGFLNNAKGVCIEAALHAAGKQTAEQFDQFLTPGSGKVSPNQAKADRLVHLGIELTRHGLYDLAEARFTEAGTLVEGHFGAALALGELMLRRDRLQEGERAFRSILVSHPDSQEAALGLAAVQIRRGDELAQADSIVQTLVEKNPSQPRARYLRGRLLEIKGDVPGAAAEYRKAAELMLDR